MASVEERVKKVVAESLAVPLEKVTDDARFVEDLGADGYWDGTPSSKTGLDILELIAAFEEEFEWELADEEKEPFTSVRAAIECAERRLS
ncbi:acyl carrier protein [Streptomyces sp. NPDC057689]|uniref:acyl carrier protein n=1 Tax=Streptomyces sp. NPDC057689 TaxID=3346213 RepID=UPI00368B3C41